jgi:hypothetical protein
MVRPAYRIVLAVLIVAAAALFVIGVTIERSQSDADTDERTYQTVGEAHHDEGEEAPAPAAREPTKHTEEARILGINPESIPLLVLATAASLLLAAAALRWPHTSALLAVVALAMIAFAVLDIREVAHQLDDDRASIAILAAFIATLHLAAGVLAATHIPRPQAPA